MTVNSNGIGKHRGTILIGEIMTNGFYVIELTLDRFNNTAGLCIIGKKFKTWVEYIDIIG